MLNTINPQNLVITDAQWMGLGPYAILSVGILILMLMATLSVSRQTKLPLFLFACITVVAAMVWTGMHWVKEPIQVFGGALVLDYFSSFFTMLLLSATLLVVLGSYSYLEEGEIHYSEFYTLLISSTLGMMLLAASAELITLFVSLELMSLMVYVLVGMRRMNARSNEASLKYFVMGGVSAAIYLYGTALIYGALNTTKLAQISMLLSQDGSTALSNPILIIGMVLLFVGFMFKVAAAPFHMWTPDVYEGAPSNITSYMATALKAAVFAALVRVSVSIFGDQGISLMGNLQGVIHGVIWWLALLTMVVGNFVALMQSNIKRLMAYSAIAHTGYLLIGLLAGPVVGYSGIIFYLVAYVVMNLGAFSLLSLFGGKDDSALTLPNLAGMSKRHPMLAAALTLFLLSLAGFPPTVGFVGKYYLFTGAIEAGETLLVLLGLVTSAVSAFYYLRIVVLMYMGEGQGTLPFKASRFAYLAIAICVFLTLNYGLFPGALLHAVKKAAVF
jgi:NADH-quinone oxidoreductase subunit N